MACLLMKKTRGVATNIYLRENVRKTKNDEGLRILKIRVRELFTHGEGIRTGKVLTPHLPVTRDDNL